MLNIMIIVVEPKIRILFFLVKEPNADVTKDFSVSFIFISLSDENVYVTNADCSFISIVIM